MKNYTFEITDPEYWKSVRGYAVNGGKDLDIERLNHDLIAQIKLNVFVVSGNTLIDFGGPTNNANISLLVATQHFEIKKNVVQAAGNKDPKKKLRGTVVSGVKVRCTNGALPYRWRVG